MAAILCRFYAQLWNLAGLGSGSLTEMTELLAE